MEKDILFEIQKNYDGFRKSEKKVADLLLHYGGDLSELKLETAAEMAGVSQPTVVRFAKAMGFAGYKELWTELVRQGTDRRPRKEEESCWEHCLRGDTSIEEVPEAVIVAAERHLREVLKHVSAKRLAAVVRVLCSARRIAVYGVENSSAIAMDLVTKLVFLGLDASYSQDYYLQTVGTARFGPGDAAIAVSYTGTTVQTLRALQQAGRQGACTIALTNSQETPVAKAADIVLATDSAQFLYGDAVFSRISQMAVVDMIYMGIIASDYGHYTKKLDEAHRLIRRLAYQMDPET